MGMIIKAYNFCLQLVLQKLSRRKYANQGGIWDPNFHHWEWRDKRGLLHRTDGPALIMTDGSEQWHLHGEVHREDGPALTGSYGYQAWCQHGQYHKQHGPARIWGSGRQEWYERGRRHCTEGPAVTFTDGDHAWYVHGEDITRQVEVWMCANNITLPFTPEQQAEFLLRWL